MVLDIGGGLFGQSDVRETNINKTLKTRYYAIAPTAWKPRNPDIDDVEIRSYSAKASANGIYFCAPVNLPHGAIVTNVIIYGNLAAEAETWFLYKVTAAGATQMATANFNSADSSITNATIDNLNNAYAVESTTLDTDDRIYFGVITYTTDVIEV